MRCQALVVCLGPVLDDGRLGQLVQKLSVCTHHEAAAVLLLVLLLGKSAQLALVYHPLRVSLYHFENRSDRVLLEFHSGKSVFNEADPVEESLHLVVDHLLEGVAVPAITWRFLLVVLAGVEVVGPVVQDLLRIRGTQPYGLVEALENEF